MSSTAFNASFVESHTTKLFFEPDSFISVTALVSRKAENSKIQNAVFSKRKTLRDLTLVKIFTYKYFFTWYG